MRRKCGCESAERALPGRKTGSSPVLGPVSAASGELSVTGTPRRSTLGHLWMQQTVLQRRLCHRRCHTQRHLQRHQQFHQRVSARLALRFLPNAHTVVTRCTPNTRTTSVRGVGGATAAATNSLVTPIKTAPAKTTPASRRTFAKTPQAHPPKMW
jgi:hypothetical protein